MRSEIVLSNGDRTAQFRAAKQEPRANAHRLMALAKLLIPMDRWSTGFDQPERVNVRLPSWLSRYVLLSLYRDPADELVFSAL